MSLCARLTVPGAGFSIPVTRTVRARPAGPVRSVRLVSGKIITRIKIHIYVLRILKDANGIGYGPHILVISMR